MPPLLPRATVIASALRRHDRANPLRDGRGVQLARRIANGLMKINKEGTAQQTCEGGGDVVGVVTPLVGGVAQAFHDDRVVELRVQLGVQEVEGKDREEQVEVERGESRRCAHG